jgi:OOP family OmpA-OmpF porin
VLSAVARRRHQPSGHLPSDDLRKQVIAMAASVGAGAAVSDAIQLGAGAPAGDFAGALAFAVSELGKLSQGKVAVSDGKIIVEGQGRQNILGETIRADAKARLPSGFEIARLDVMAGPMTPYVSAPSAPAETLRSPAGADESNRPSKLQQELLRREGADRLLSRKARCRTSRVTHHFAALARLDEGKSHRDLEYLAAGVARHQSALRRDGELAMRFPWFRGRRSCRPASSARRLL